MTMRWSVLLLSCVLLVAYTASGADKPLDKGAVVQSADPRKIKAADRNGDGKIDIYEYHHALSRDFDTADTSNDGVLDAQEVERMWDSAVR